jgi:hypothetical protein
MVVSMAESGGVCIWQESVAWSQAIGFVLARLAGIWLVALKMFSHFI